MLNKRYVYQFRLTHCPTGTIATYNIPADSQFEAEALIGKFIGKERGDVPDYWSYLADPARFDTADSAQQAQMKKFDVCGCENYVGGLHYTQEGCVI